MADAAGIVQTSADARAKYFKDHAHDKPTGMNMFYPHAWQSKAMAGLVGLAIGALVFALLRGLSQIFSWNDNTASNWMKSLLVGGAIFGFVAYFTYKHKHEAYLNAQFDAQSDAAKIAEVDDAMNASNEGGVGERPSEPPAW